MRFRRQPRLQPRPLVGALGLALAGLAHPQALGLLETPPRPTEEGLPALEMLMEGSILQRVLIPQYDNQLRLSSTLRAAQLTMVDRRVIDADTVRLSFFNPDRSLKAIIDLESARLINQQTLRSNQPVELLSNDLAVRGSGLVYDLETSRGFLLGPATARTRADTRTSMLSPSSAFAGLLMVSSPAFVFAAEGLQTLTSQQTEGLDRLAASKADAAGAAADDAAEKLAAAEESSAEAAKTLAAFLEEAAIDLPPAPPSDLSQKVPDPAEVAAKLPATIAAQDGIYFDSTAGLLVFLKDVEVDHPEFTLEGADEVKVFFDKDEAEAPAEEEGGLGSANFGDPSKIIASGVLVLERKTNGDDRPVKASGRQMVYDLATEELIIRGGEPWIISDTANGRVVDPNGYIRINLQSGNASFVGASRGFIETDR